MSPADVLSQNELNDLLNTLNSDDDKDVLPEVDSPTQIGFGETSLESNTGPVDSRDISYFKATGKCLPPNTEIRVRAEDLLIYCLSCKVNVKLTGQDNEKEYYSCGCSKKLKRLF